VPAEVASLGVDASAQLASRNPDMGSLQIPSKRYIPEHYSVVVIGAEDGPLR
jgi:hypothetical protein